jgi:hypothetical protein
LRILNYHRIHPWDVDSIFDDGGGEKDIVIPLRKGRNVILCSMVCGAMSHSSMGLNDMQLWKNFLEQKLGPLVKVKQVLLQNNNE